MPDIVLHVNGRKYAGWTAQRITRSIEKLAHSFAVELTDRWQQEGRDIPVQAGDACSVSYGDDWVTVGYIDSDSASYDAQQHTVSFEGRSKTGDLVDCSSIHKGGQWRNKGLLQIAKDLCAPFEIEVSTNVDLGDPFTTFVIEDGETVFQTIEWAAKHRGVLLLTKADGNLVFDRMGATKVRTQLEYGKNIKAGSKRNCWSDRFSRYTVKAQAPGSDNSSGEACTIKRSSDDVGITRYRPTIISADEENSGSELQKRADWERNVRVGRAKRLTYTVQGWEHQNGLWEPNTLVSVVDPVCHIDDELLIVETTHARSEDEGTVTSLVLTFPEAFSVAPLPPANKRKGSLV